MDLSLNTTHLRWSSSLNLSGHGRPVLSLLKVVHHGRRTLLCLRQPSFLFCFVLPLGTCHPECLLFLQSCLNDNLVGLQLKDHPKRTCYCPAAQGLSSDSLATAVVCVHVPLFSPDPTRIRCKVFLCVGQGAPGLAEPPLCLVQCRSYCTHEDAGRRRQEEWV